MRLLFAGGRSTRGFLLPMPAWLELDRSRDNSEKNVGGVGLLRGDRLPPFVVEVVFAVAEDAMDLMGLCPRLS